MLPIDSRAQDLRQQIPGWKLQCGDNMVDLGSDCILAYQKIEGDTGVVPVVCSERKYAREAQEGKAFFLTKHFNAISLFGKQPTWIILCKSTNRSIANMESFIFASSCFPFLHII